MTERASLWSDPATRRALRQLSGIWGMSMADALRRLVNEALRAERGRESGSSAEAGQ